MPKEAVVSTNQQCLSEVSCKRILLGTFLSAFVKTLLTLQFILCSPKGEYKVATFSVRCPSVCLSVRLSHIFAQGIIQLLLLLNVLVDLDEENLFGKKKHHPTFVFFSYCPSFIFINDFVRTPTAYVTLTYFLNYFQVLDNPLSWCSGEKNTKRR